MHILNEMIVSLKSMAVFFFHNISYMFNMKRELTQQFN